MRLLYFDLTQGNRIGTKFIIDELGWMRGARLIGQLKWNEAFDNPFKALNQNNKPTSNQKLSQRQMAPLVILYGLLQKEGYTKDAALEFCRKLSRNVAVAFLKYNIPEIKKSDWDGESQEHKLSMLNKLASRFFNAESDKEIHADNEFVLNIHTCHFASYAMQLNVPELGRVFCESDKYYFEQFQKEVDFSRTQTLAIDGRPCDFRFTWMD